MDSASVVKAGLQQLLVFVVLVFLIYPFVLSALNRLISRFWSPYWRTVGTVVLVGIAATIADFIVGRIVGLHHPWALRVVGVIVTALVGGGIMNAFVRHKDGEPLGYQRAALACLIFGIIVVLIWIALAPWEKGVAAKFKAGMPTPATASSAPAAAASGPARIASVTAPATVPGAASVPATTQSTPASAASTH